MKISRVTPHGGQGIYSTWRRTGAIYRGREETSLTQPKCTEDLTKAAMEELRDLWKQEEKDLLHEFSQIYRQHNLNSNALSTESKEVLTQSKSQYNVIDLKTGHLLQTHTNSNYQIGYDGSHFLELKLSQNQQYSIVDDMKAINDYILVSKDTIVANQLKLYNRIKDVDVCNKENIKLNLVQGVPGCGKSSFIVNNYRDGDLVLSPTREGAEDLRARLAEIHPEQKGKIHDACRTVHSFIINSTKHIKTGGKYKRIILDEAFMLHAGEILYSCAFADVNEALLIGDANQIPYINRTKHKTQHHDIMRLATVTKTLSHSYRCTSSTAALLSNLYDQGMTTSNPSKGETKILKIADCSQLYQEIDKKTHKVLVFKQSEKTTLLEMGYDVSTIHEYQGKQADHIAVVRISNNKDEKIYSSQPHCIVAISRHKKSLTYLTAQSSDTLSAWIKQMNTFPPQKIANHFRRQVDNTAPAEPKITEIDQQPPTTACATPDTIQNNKIIVEAQVHHPAAYSPPRRTRTDIIPAVHNKTEPKPHTAPAKKSPSPNESFLASRPWRKHKLKYFKTRFFYNTLQRQKS